MTTKMEIEEANMITKMAGIGIKTCRGGRNDFKDE